MTEKWLIAPGDTRVIDVERAQRLKISLVGGQVDVIAHDEPGIRIEVHDVTVKDLRIEHDGSLLEIDHPQRNWDNFLEVFRDFGSGGPRAEISVAVPRDIALTLGVVSASALVSGLAETARLNTVSGDLIVDAHAGDLTINAVSGDVQAQRFDGAFSANSVSGDVAVAGTPARVSIDTMAGALVVDASAPVDTIGLNTAAGNATVRLPDELPVKYSARSVTGRLLIDGIDRGSGLPSSYTGSSGELSGTFVDLRFNSVSGDLTVVRQTAASGRDHESEQAS